MCENSVDASQPAPHNLPGTSAEIVMPTKTFADALLRPVLVLIAHYRLSSLPCHSLSSYSPSFFLLSCWLFGLSIPVSSTQDYGSADFELIGSIDHSDPHTEYEVLA